MTKPRWSLEFDIEENMKMRVVNGNVEWEFSIWTAHLWSSILAMLLRTIINNVITGTEYRNNRTELRKQPLEHEETKFVQAITSFYRYFS